MLVASLRFPASRRGAATRRWPQGATATFQIWRCKRRDGRTKNALTTSLHGDLVDGAAFAEVFDFVVGVDAAVDDAGFGDVEGNLLEEGFGPEDGLDLLEVFGVIGLDGQSRARGEGAGG